MHDNLSLNGGMARPVVIVGGIRIPFCKADTAYTSIGNAGMMTATVQALVGKYGLYGLRLGDVALGAVLHHARDWNLAREVVFNTQLARETPGFVVQQACGTSLEAAVLIANKIALGQIDCGIAGGADSVSDVPVVYKQRFARRLLTVRRARHWRTRLAAWQGFRPAELAPSLPRIAEPSTGLSMGEHTERMAKEWGIDRLSQDQFALTSHHNAQRAYEDGFYDDLLTTCEGVQRDNIMRPDTSLEKLAALAPVYDRGPSGTLTAGNSTLLTDGASCVLLASEDWARRHNLPVQAYLTHARVAAVDFIDHEGLLMAPAYAVSSLLEAAQLTLQDFDFYEFHEAFAAQVLCTLRAWESSTFCRERLQRAAPLGAIDGARLNVNGGSLALGHPFAATGTRIVATLAKLLEERGVGRGLISVCTAGGMGLSAILERRAGGAG